jgi:cytochrome P450
MDDSKLLKMAPVLHKASKSGGLSTYSNSSRNPENGAIRPIIFVGPSVGFDPMVSVADSRCFGEIMNNLENFPKYLPLYNILGLIIGKGLVTAAGEQHKRQRKIVTPVFHFAALKSAMAAIEKGAIEFVNVDLPSDGLVITQESFKRFTLSVIMDYAFGGCFDKTSMQKSWQAIGSLITSQFLLTRLLGDLAKYLPTPYNIQVLLVRWRIRQFLARRRAFLRQENITSAALLHIVGDRHDPRPAAAPAAATESASESASPALSIERGLGLADQLLLTGCPTRLIVDECTTFLFAGHETSSSLLAWAAYELSRSPAAQARAREEVARVIGAGPVCAVPFEASKSLDFVTAVLRETLRLWPPAPQLPRVCERDGWAVDGVAVPRGTVVEINIFAAHRSPRLPLTPVGL